MYLSFLDPENKAQFDAIELDLEDKFERELDTLVSEDDVLNAYWPVVAPRYGSDYAAIIDGADGPEYPY